MAADTPSDTASLVVHQVFPRNHGLRGTLADVGGGGRRPGVAVPRDDPTGSGAGAEPVVQLAWGAPSGADLGPTVEGPGLYGVFAVEAGARGTVDVQLPDGRYRDLLGDEEVMVVDGRLDVPRSAAILEFERPFTARPWRSLLLDLFLHVEHFGDRRPVAGDAY